MHQFYRLHNTKHNQRLRDINFNNFLRGLEMISDREIIDEIINCPFMQKIIVEME